jgi:hypothetical protein
MSITPGEMLIEAGLLTRAQLEAAQKNQVIFGGRLETSLIELGYLAEEDLARFLSKKLELPCATAEQLMSVTPDIIQLIPREVAEKYKVIPLGRDKKRLTLAMLDPADLSATDAISFITGYYIIPLIAPELQLVLALDNFYGIKPDVRYFQLIEKRKKFPGAIKHNEPEVETFKESEEIDFSLSQEDKEITAFQEVMKSVVEPANTESLNTSTFDMEPEVIELPEAAPANYSLESVAEKLAEAKDREEIAEIITMFLGHEFDRVVLFLIKGTVFDGWRASLNNSAYAGIENLRLPLDEPSVLKVVNDGRSFYLGPIPDIPGNARMLAGMGGGAPSSALLIPLMMMGRVVAIIYVDGGKEPLSNRLADLQTLVGKASMAFEILILKNKILMT